MSSAAGSGGLTGSRLGSLGRGRKASAGSVLARLLGVLAGALCVALLCGGVALAAAPVEVPSAAISEGSFPGGVLISPFNPYKVATDEATGDVYIEDPANGVVDRFTAAGTYLSQINTAEAGGSFNFGEADQIAVDNSGGPGQGSLYVVSELAHFIYAFDAQGKFLWKSNEGLGDPCGVAVDSKGNVWTSDFGNGVQQRSLTEKGKATGGALAVGASGCAIAFDSSDNLYLNIFGGGIKKYAAPAYTSPIELSSSNPAADVAVDPSNDSVYTARPSSVGLWDSAGVEDSESPFDSGVSPKGIAVDGAHGKLYVADASTSSVQVFTTAGAATPKPSVRTGTASNFTATTADIGGMVNPNGSTTTCEAQYVTDAQFAVNGFQSALSQACKAGVGSGTSEVAVSASLSGLTEGATYHYRLIATNANGTIDGSAAVVTMPVPHQLTVKVEGTGAGTVSADSGPISGCTSGGGVCTGSYSGTVTLTATPSATSTFAGWSGGGCSGTGTCKVTMSADTTVTATFDQDPPVAVTGAASGVTQTGATLAGTVNPKGATTACHFDYGATTAYGSSAPCASAPGAGESAVGVSATLAGLSASTTYHYRLVATNSSPTSPANGTDKTFTTESVPVEKPAEKPVEKAAEKPVEKPVEKAPPAAGSVSVSAGKIKAGKVQITVRCKGSTGATCSGTAKITVKVKKGKKTKTLTVASVSYSLTAGQSKAAKVKLPGAVAALLKKGKHLRVSVTAPGLKNTITLG